MSSHFTTRANLSQLTIFLLTHEKNFIYCTWYVRGVVGTNNIIIKMNGLVYILFIIDLRHYIPALNSYSFFDSLCGTFSLMQLHFIKVFCRM